jgi:hypothetical protein
LFGLSHNDRITELQDYKIERETDYSLAEVHEIMKSCNPVSEHKTERPMSDIGLSRLAETFSLKVTVLTPVTAPVIAILSTYPAASIKQNDCLLSEVIFIFGEFCNQNTKDHSEEWSFMRFQI